VDAEILDADDARIILQELKWAEKAMEMYRVQKQQLPLRSEIRAVHVHSQEWRDGAFQLLSGSSQDEAERGNLRGST